MFVVARAGSELFPRFADAVRSEKLAALALGGEKIPLDLWESSADMQLANTLDSTVARVFFILLIAAVVMMSGRARRSEAPWARVAGWGIVAIPVLEVAEGLMSAHLRYPEPIAKAALAVPVVAGPALDILAVLVACHALLLAGHRSHAWRFFAAGGVLGFAGALVHPLLWFLIGGADVLLREGRTIAFAHLAQRTALLLFGLVLVGRLIAARVEGVGEPPRPVVGD